MKARFYEGRPGLDLDTLELVSVDEGGDFYILVRGEEVAFLKKLIGDLGEDGVGKLLFRLIKSLIQARLLHEAAKDILPLSNW